MTLDDLVLAVPGRREAYVVFGRTSTATVELAAEHCPTNAISTSVQD